MQGIIYFWVVVQSGLIFKNERKVLAVNTILLFIIVILISSILQTSTGFGFSILATPFLILIFDVREAIQINLLLSLVISLALIVKISRDVNWDIFRRFVIGSVIGLPIGIMVFLVANMTMLKVAVGVLILVLTVLLMLNYRIRQTGRRDFVIGGLSGAFTTGIGMPGPPVLLYFSGTGVTKETLRATTLAFYLIIYALSLVVQIVFAGTSKTVWTWSIYALPVVVAGLIIGQWLFPKLNQYYFRLLIYGLLLFTGAYLLWQQL